MLHGQKYHFGKVRRNCTGSPKRCSVGQSPSCDPLLFYNLVVLANVQWSVFSLSFPLVERVLFGDVSEWIKRGVLVYPGGSILVTCGLQTGWRNECREFINTSLVGCRPSAGVFGNMEAAGIAAKSMRADACEPGHFICNDEGLATTEAFSAGWPKMLE